MMYHTHIDEKNHTIQLFARIGVILKHFTTKDYVYFTTNYDQNDQILLIMHNFYVW